MVFKILRFSVCLSLLACVSQVSAQDLQINFAGAFAQDVKIKHSPRIIGGEDAGLEEFPSYAFVIYCPLGSISSGACEVAEPEVSLGCETTNSSGACEVTPPPPPKFLYRWCGGVLVADRSVLTAAHCTIANDNDPERFAVAFFFSLKDSSKQQAFRVTKIVSHPKYNHDTGDNDISILTLERAPIGVTAAKLPIKGFTEKLEIAAKISPLAVTAVGFGDTDGSISKAVYPQTLQKVELNLFDRDRCEKDGIFNGSREFTSNMICAGGDGKDTCNGDSGGPLFLDDTVIGLTSFGPAECAAPNTVGVYTRVESVLEFIDEDQDGILGTDDNCPTVRNPSQANFDSDEFGDACDTDADNDTILDVNDKCLFLQNELSNADSDGDGLGDVCEDDDDGDGVNDAQDNCLNHSNNNQQDTDGDGIGDACEDSDNDDVTDSYDNCPTASNSNQADTDRDGVGDVCDSDNDGDGIDDSVDLCPHLNSLNQSDNDHDGQGDECDADDDNDGVNDDVDTCRFIVGSSAEEQADIDGDSRGSVCDEDDDGDSKLDAEDNCPGTSNNDQRDFDGDSIGDACDTAVDYNEQTCRKMNVNGEDLITSNDAFMVLSVVNGNSEANPRYEYDVNGDGSITKEDAIIIITCLELPGGCLCNH